MNARLGHWSSAALSLVRSVGGAGGGGPAPAPADVRAITAFRFGALAVTGTIDQGARTISVTEVDGVGLSWLAGPRGIAVDTVNDRLHAANGTAGTITVHAGASAATGNLAPVRTISGAAAGYSSPGGLALW